VSRFLTNKLKLKVNEAKSAVAPPEERKFLGFSISNDGSSRRIAPKALDKFKDASPGPDWHGPHIRAKSPASRTRQAKFR